MTVETMTRVDNSTAGRLEEMLNQAFELDSEEVIIDMTDTVYMSSAGLRSINRLQKRLKAVGGNLEIINVQPQIMEIFDITGFSGFLNIQ